MSLIGTSGDAASGRKTSPRERFREVVETAEFTELRGATTYPRPLDGPPRATLELFAAEVAPVVRREFPSRACADFPRSSVDQAHAVDQHLDLVELGANPR